MKHIYVNRMLAAFLAGTLVLAPAACVGAASTDDGGDAASAEEAQDSLLEMSESGDWTAHFDKTEKGAGGSTGITIEAGEPLVIGMDLAEGKVQVRVVRDNSEENGLPVLNNDTAEPVPHGVEENRTAEYRQIEPGNYLVNVLVQEDASGSILFSKNAVEQETAEEKTEPEIPLSPPEIYYGSWVTGDYLLNIGEGEDGMYASVYLQPAGDDTTEWLYSGVSYDEVADELNTVETGIKTSYVFDEEGIIDDVVEEFDDGAASFRLTEDGKLVWRDYKETPGKNEITFERSPKLIEAPSLLE